MMGITCHDKLKNALAKKRQGVVIYATINDR